MGKSKSTNKGKDVQSDGKKRKREEKPVSLFGQAVKDAELDDIFSKSTSFAQNAPVASSSKIPSTKNDAEVPLSERSKKSPSPESGSDNDEVVSANGPEEEEEDEEEEDDSEDEAAEIIRLAELAEAEGDNADDVEDDDEDEEAEDEGDDVVQREDENDDESESESELVHESVKAKKEKSDKGKKAQKYTPPGESASDKDRRTVFVGNLPLEAAKSKSMLHQLQAHLLSFVPSAKIESTRFRSVPFASATSALPTDDPEKDENKRLKREKERASAWRAKQDGVKPDEEVDQAKVFIDSKGKRKVAFIKKDFHSELGSCNAYVVFAHPHPDRAANVAPIMNPYEAASAVLAANGSTCLERTIRVDSVRLPSSIGLASATNALSKRDAWLPSGTDPKKSLFVGGLDYASKEEDIRVFFEELVKGARGPAEDKWVIGVRVVRDKETQLGKGFGYVHFIDRESVEEILAMDASKIRFAKRALRVQPCKTLPSSGTLNNQLKAAAQRGRPEKDKAGKGKSTTSNGRNSAPVRIPKGNPKLGEKLKDLSKEDRKIAKSTDAERQARRLAKKKLRGKMDKNESGKVNLSLTKAEKERTKGGKPKAKKGKKRAPSAIAKMKGARV